MLGFMYCHMHTVGQPDGVLSYHLLLVWQDMAQHAATMFRHLARHERELQSRPVDPMPEYSSSQERKVRQKSDTPQSAFLLCMR